MTSRVVPASSETIAASRRASALSRLDLPAFGGPAKQPGSLPARSRRGAIVEMSRDFRREHRGPFACFGEATTPPRRPRRLKSMAASVRALISNQLASANPRRASKARRRFVPAPGGVELRFRHRRDPQGPRPERDPACRSRRRGGRIRLARRGGIPAISPSAPSTACDRRTTAVDLELGDVLAGLGAWRGEPNHQRTIERFAGLRMRGRSGMPHSAASVAALRQPGECVAELRGPDRRMTATPARPGALESAKMVEASVMEFA